jgi:hypothetical protein
LTKEKGLMVVGRIPITRTIIVETLFSIVSTKSLLMATGPQLRGGVVQFPFDIG